MHLLWCKANIKCFGFNNLHQDFDIMRVVHTAMGASRDKRSKYSQIQIYIYFIYIYKQDLILNNPQGLI